ncbi:hypothetical protein EDB80DRAFT_610480 [Ilyonectria destructans]|nr:hypothetical protein EDB80DRAFT_610480 [Ilyonectria destructans]
MESVHDYRKRIASEFLGTTNRKYELYFKLYDQLVTDSGVYILQVDQPEPNDPATISHDDVLAAAAIIRGHPEKTLHQVTQDLQKQLKTIHRVKFAVRVAVRVMFMLDSAISDSHGPGFSIGGYRHVSWQPCESLHEFVLGSFPRASKESAKVMAAMADKRSMKAWKLKTRLGITFKGTDNISEHLLFDIENCVLYLFHHSSFLKAQLGRLQSQCSNKEDDLPTCLGRGALPPRLLAETLHSMQSILFHWSDRRSGTILQRLIQRKGFDEDCAEPEGYMMFDDSLDDFEYLYWGERLAALYDLVTDRPPRNKFERWIKWQTSESSAFAVALAALAISIVVGVLSLGLSAFQVWIAWRAWKDTTNPNGGAGRA